MRASIFLSLAVFCAALCFSSPIMAQETAPGDPCDPGEENYIRQTGGPETSGVVHLLRCDGATWQRLFSTGGYSDLFFEQSNSDSQIRARSGYLRLEGGAGGNRVIADDDFEVGSDRLINALGDMMIDIAVDDTDDRSLRFMWRGDERIRFDPNGRVGIGVTTPDYPLEVDGGIKAYENSGSVFVSSASGGESAKWFSAGASDMIIRNARGGSANPPLLLQGEGEITFWTGHDPGGTTNLQERMIIAGDGNVGIRTPTPTEELDVVGDIAFTGVLRDISDRRKKRDVRVLTDALDKIGRIDGVSFVMKEGDGATELGLIAQDVEAVYPELVATGPDGIKSLNYQGMIGPLVEAVKELDAANDAQDAAHAAEIARLEAENAELRRMVHTLSRRMDVLEGKVRPTLAPYNR